jgi:hypothetical protein
MNNFRIISTKSNKKAEACSFIELIDATYLNIAHTQTMKPIHM